MNQSSFDPEAVLRELERLAIGAAREARVKVDQVFEQKGYESKSLAEQKAFMEGAKVGGLAMLDVLGKVIPKILGLEPPHNDKEEENGTNPFSP